MLGRRRWAVLGALVATLLPLRARADVIGAPPACPPGSHGRTTHTGSWCVPWKCAIDTDCGEGSACKPWRVCTRAGEVYAPGGHSIADSPPPERVPMVVGTCDPAAACRGDEEPPPVMTRPVAGDAPVCVVADHCVESDLPPLPLRSGEVPVAPASAATPAPASGCGCAVDPRGGPNVGWLGLVALARRRRR